MLSFKNYIKEFVSEAYNSSDLEPKQEKEISLFAGRLQPPNLGHAAVIKLMKTEFNKSGTEPYIAIVDGDKSSQNKKENPLSFSYRKSLVKEIDSEVNIIKEKDGYLPRILSELRQDGLEVTIFYAGKDRMKTYKSDFKSFNDSLEDDKKFNIKFVPTDRIAQGSDVRQALIDYNNAKTKEESNKAEQDFQDNMPEVLWDKITSLAKYMKDIKNLKEEAETTTQSIETIDKPINTAIVKRIEPSDFSKDKQNWDNKPEEVKEKKEYKKRISTL